MEPFSYFFPNFGGGSYTSTYTVVAPKNQLENLTFVSFLKFSKDLKSNNIHNNLFVSCYNEHVQQDTY